MPSERRIQRIAIVGGGTAGWMAASALARMLRHTGCCIHLIESADIPTVGVGEATIPPILDFLRFLGIDQQNFIEHTQGTYKLGIRFTDWHHLGHTYWHPFGLLGNAIDRLPFYRFWQKARAQGVAPPLRELNLEWALGDANKFVLPQNSMGIASQLRYALHFDASLVARYLRVYAERYGVVRLERSVTGATLRSDGGIDTLLFADGSRLQADLYVDCTGFRGLLIEQTQHTGYVDWTHVLPCNRAVALWSPTLRPRPPCTLAKARPAGWQWGIPLQHRLGSGYVYSSAHVSDDDALQDLLAAIGTAPVTEPRFLRFVTGHRRQFWNRNCVALGLASGFIEPLESTSIQLMISGIYNLLDHFPDRDFDPVNIAEYNSQMIEEFERIRDFIVLHYCTTTREDTPFWRECRERPIPDDLLQRMELYRATGRVFPKRRELFTELSWFFVLEGMGVLPRNYDPLVDGSDFQRVLGVIEQLRTLVAADVAAAPTHDSFFATAAPLARDASSTRAAMT